MQNLLRHLGIQFKNIQVLEQALTHSSAGKKAGGQPYHNERLEFLGDRILNVTVAEWLYREFPKASEGELAKRHAALISQPVLAEIAQTLEVGEALILGKGEETTGGRQKPSMLADAVEAMLAAIYLDQELQVAQGIIHKLWAPYIHTVEMKDPKSVLQEWLQAKGLPLPAYTVLSEEGASHRKVFTVEANAGKHGKATGEGSSKQQAELAAARKLLEQLNDN